MHRFWNRKNLCYVPVIIKCMYAYYHIIIYYYTFEGIYHTCNNTFSKVNDNSVTC